MAITTKIFALMQNSIHANRSTPVTGHAITLALALTVLSFGLVSSPAATANEGKETGPKVQGPWKKVEFSIGGYATSHGSSLRIDPGDGTLGDPLDLERQLKVDKSLFKVRADARLRIGRRHTLQAAYYDGSRGGVASLSEELVIGDETFVLDASLETKISLGVYKFSYGYSFVANEKWDVAAAVGVHALDLGASFFGQARVDAFSVEARAEAKDTFAPLPVIGGRFAYALSPKWRLRGEFDWLKLKIGDLSGNLIDLTLGVDFDITRNFGLTAHYNYVDIEVNSRDLGFPGRVGYSYSAALLGGRVFF